MKAKEMAAQAPKPTAPPPPPGQAPTAPAYKPESMVLPPADPNNTMSLADRQYEHVTRVLQAGPPVTPSGRRKPDFNQIADQIAARNPSLMGSEIDRMATDIFMREASAYHMELGGDGGRPAPEARAPAPPVPGAPPKKELMAPNPTRGAPSEMYKQTRHRMPR